MQLPDLGWKSTDKRGSRCLAFVLISGATVFCLGCGSSKPVDPNRASISGAVTYDGKPLPAGAITFASVDGNLASTISIEAGGRYSTDRAPLGPNQVTIDTASIKYGNPASFVAIPAKYADPTKSGLTVEVKPGVNENVNFDLKP